MMQEASARYELKFLIPKDCNREAQALIRLHPARFSPLYNPRRVNNIYLDDHDWSHYNAAANGDERRVKVRIRWYGALFGEIVKPILELKYKTGPVGSKLSFPLAPFVLDGEFHQRTLKTVFDSSSLPGLLRSNLMHMEPSLLNSYSREYFMSNDQNFRVTLDTDIEFSFIHPHKNSFSYRQRGDSHIVMELKYAAEQSGKAHQITNHFPYRLTKNSKYFNGVEGLYS